ncbi:MAG: histidine kinase [Nitrospirae bacterium RBG_13_39_12]|nr:MAG: histidine kinase [Nitrospirae bacterium RBG_13_39_12]
MPEGGKMAQILIVDDEVDMLALLAMIITEKTSHKATTTNNPLEVPKLIKEGNFDLIITDLKMPGMDGIELISGVRKIDKSIPILIITAYGSIESAEEAIHKGAYDYITKPFRKEQILIAINRALEWKEMKSQIDSLKGDK